MFSVCSMVFVGLVFHSPIEKWSHTKQNTSFNIQQIRRWWLLSNKRACIASLHMNMVVAAVDSLLFLISIYFILRLYYSFGLYRLHKPILSHFPFIIFYFLWDIWVFFLEYVSGSIRISIQCVRKRILTTWSCWFALYVVTVLYALSNLIDT